MVVVHSVGRSLVRLIVWFSKEKKLVLCFGIKLDVFILLCLEIFFFFFNCVACFHFIWLISVEHTQLLYKCKNVVVLCGTMFWNQNMCNYYKKNKRKGKINIENKMLSLLNVAADKMETKKKTLSFFFKSWVFSKQQI